MIVKNEICGKFLYAFLLGQCSDGAQGPRVCSTTEPLALLIDFS